jgi:hypothetical protein
MKLGKIEAAFGGGGAVVVVVLLLLLQKEMKRRRFLLHFVRVKRQAGSLASFHSSIPVVLYFIVSSTR